MLHLDASRKRELYARQGDRRYTRHFGHARSEDPGFGTDAWIRHLCPHRTDEQGCFPPQCGLVISCHSKIREGWANRWRMESYRKQQASEVLRPDAEGAKETQ